jgi:uncharacterized protein (DUF1800 family)
VRGRNPTEKGGPVDPAWAWATYQPDGQRPWDLAKAGHLFRRAGFGANWTQLQQALADGPQEAVEKLLRPEADVAAFNRDCDEYETASSADNLRAWWLRRAILTPHPLLEKMTLFWHDHFGVSNAKVKDASLMQQHVQLLRTHALGQFEPVLQAVSRDPAVLLGVDATNNRRSSPNENYARNLMARFSLGPGQFSEKDVLESARAFTGWTVLRKRLRYIDREHDPGVKKVLGQEGNFAGEDVVRIVLRQAATPRFLVRKLYRFLISEVDEPSDSLIESLAESFADGYDVSRLVETMLRSNLFFSPMAYRQRIKNPVEFGLGIVSALEALVPTARLGADLADLGQNLYHPPTVEGWPSGRYWINSATVVGRSNLAKSLLAGKGPYGGKLDPAAVAKKHGHTAPEEAGRFLLDLFVQGDVEDRVTETMLKTVATMKGSTTERLRRFAHAVVALPEYQLA